MSALNGDKSRFNRERKQKIARRKRNHDLLNHNLLNQDLLKRAASQPKSTGASSRGKQEPVSA